MLCLRRLGLLALALFGFVSHASAQTTPNIISQWTSYGIGGQFNIQWGNPNISSPKQIACSAASGNNCFLLNQAACSAAPVPIVIVASSQGTTPTQTSQNSAQGIYVWANNTGCTSGYAPSGTSNNPNAPSILGQQTGLSSTFINNPSLGMTFPGTVQYTAGGAALDPNGQATGNNNPLLFTHLDLMNQYGACNGAPVNLTTYYLCIGVDGNGSGCIGQACSGSTTAGSGDYIAWAQVQYDTQPPNPPTLSNAKPMNGRVSFTVTYDSATLDTYYINIYSSNDPDNVAMAQNYNANDPNTGCGAWTDNFVITPYGVQPQTGTLPQTINATNGTTWAYCAQAQDYLRNLSTISAPVVLTPQFECDLFDCYPGELQTGFCGAALPAAWYVLPALGLGLRGLRRRRG